MCSRAYSITTTVTMTRPLPLWEQVLAKLPLKVSEAAPGIDLAAVDFDVWLHQWAVDDNKVAKVWVERKYGKKKRPPTKM